MTGIACCREAPPAGHEGAVHIWAICESSKQAVRDHFSDGDTSTLPLAGARVESCSNDLVVHYAFDMAQQVHYPSDPFQPGPLYLLTPRKCGIFGVCCEALPSQINYLIDEASDTGKGSISIVSMIHHLFEVHGLGETDVHLHADNCVGQNKNNNTPLSTMASDGWPSSQHHAVILGGRAHQVLPRLVFRLAEATVPTYYGGLPR